MNVAILFGGRSAEHEISLLSAQNIFNALDREKYNPVLIGIDHFGQWYYYGDTFQLAHADDPKEIRLVNKSTPVILSQIADDHRLINAKDMTVIVKIDVIFPIVHGPYGEDGSIQGLARLANLPCVGPSQLASAMGMDKDIMKRLLRDADIEIADFFTLYHYDREEYSYALCSQELGPDLFIKPANMGSSVGISKVSDPSGFKEAIEVAFQYDDKVIVEEMIEGREIECAVLGNENPIVSIPGEIIPKDGFYSYENKYIDEHGAGLEIPAVLTEEQKNLVMATAKQVYQILECEGLTRVDVFLTEENRVVINEINTLPGFTKISMYPTLLEHSGIPPVQLIDRLIQLAIERLQRKNKLKMTV
ncbi:MAG: D-alanine--D-alanine ligase [Bacteroidia bacterium]|nr:D-alanine--D-alanine ligase [Bacteroidia bacterium]